MKKIEKIVHKTADVIRAVGGKEKYRSTAAIIAAAGNSSRMKGENKQFTILNGMPVLARTVDAFEKSECIKEIVIVTRHEDIEVVIELCEKYKFNKVVAVIPGGETRQESVFKGVLEISDKTDFVAIHDGARCLITPEMVEKVCREAYIYKAATAATLSVDTVKRTEKGKGFITETMDRNNVWLAQTPQVFDANLYRAASFTAKQKGFSGTDDCSLAENVGFNSIRLVECGRENIKITTPEDLIFAKAILAFREEKEGENEDR